MRPLAATDLLRGVAVVVAAGAIGCDGTSPDPADAPAEVAPPDAEATLDLAEPDCDPVFVVGTNDEGERQPESFVPLEDGGEATIVKGSGGWWLIVAAFKTRCLFEGKVLIQARVEQNGEVLVENGFNKQALQAADDGFSYFFSYFLPFSCPPEAGTPGRLWFSMSDTFGHEAEVTIDVVFQGGPTTEEERLAYCGEAEE